MTAVIHVLGQALAGIDHRSFRSRPQAPQPPIVPHQQLVAAVAVEVEHDVGHTGEYGGVGLRMTRRARSRPLESRITIRHSPPRSLQVTQIESLPWPSRPIGSILP